MKLFRYIPAILTLCIILGILVGFYLKPNPLFVVFTLIGLLFLLSVVYYFTNKSFKKTYYFNVIGYLVFILIGIGAVSFQNIQNHPHFYQNSLKKENKVVFIITKKLKSNVYYDKYIATISQLNDDKAIGKLLLNIQKDSLHTKPIKIGDVYFAKTSFYGLNTPLNPFQFNYSSYLEKQQIFHQIKLKKSQLFYLKTDKTLYSILDKIRQKVILSLKENGFNKDELAIINTLLLGQKQTVSYELRKDYINAGAIHILAVSGLHIGIWLLILNFLFKPLERLKKGKTIKIILIVLLLWFYAFLAGLSPSIIRAVTMFSAISMGGFFKKKTSTIHSLFISMFLLLLIHPLYLFSVGFQLSYLAVFSIVYFNPLFMQLFYPKFWLIRKLWQLLAISFAAQLGTLPLSLFYFHQFPGLFFVSNVVIIPFLGMILFLGIVVILLALLNSLPQQLAIFFEWIIHKMNGFIRFIAHQEQFLFKHIAFSLLLVFASYFIMISFFQLWKHKKVSYLKWTFISVLFFQLILIYQKYQLQTTDEFLIFNKSKHTLIMDRKGQSAVLYTDDSLKVEKIITDYTIANHNLTVHKIKLQNVMKYQNSTVFIVDSLGVYQVPKLKNSFVLLRQSPKININRLITIIKPKVIIADGSNYKSYKKRWRKSCKSKGISFYDTSINGAYILKE